jgi:hypothetical protein
LGTVLPPCALSKENVLCVTSMCPFSSALYGSLTRIFLSLLTESILSHSAFKVPPAVCHLLIHDTVPRRGTLKPAPRGYIKRVVRFEESSGLVLLVDRGGSGKSVLLAELCRRGNHPLLLSQWAEADTSIFVGGFHFFDASSMYTTSVSACIGALSVLLRSSIKDLARNLPKDPDRLLVSLSHEEFFEELIITPSEATLREPVWLVIDALDECEDGPELLRILIYHTKRGPSKLGFVVSTRTTWGRDTSRARNIRALSLQERQVEDMSIYLNDVLHRLWGVSDAQDRAALTKELCGLSEGSFFWLSQQESSLREIFN